MKKILFVILLISVLSLTLVACDGLDTPNTPDLGHQHAFSDEWTYDENSHWHIATCEHTDQTEGKSSHNMQAIPADKTLAECTTCGYQATTSHQHILSKEYSANEHGHWLETTCGCDYENFAPHGFEDGVCVTCGWWKAASDVLFANLSKSDVFDYSVLLDDVCVTVVNMLDGEPTLSNLTISGELQLSLSAEGQLSGSGYFQADELVLKAVVSNNVVYALGNGNYLRCELNELLAENGIDVQAYIDELNANTQQIREYFEQVVEQISDLPLKDTELAQLWNGLVKIDEAKSQGSLTAYVVDSEPLRKLNQSLASTTVEEYVNAILGELDGTPLGVLLGSSFNDLPDNVYALLSNTIFKTITELWDNKFTLDDLFKQINGYIAKYYPDVKVNTIDELVEVLGIDIDEIAKQNGINIKGATVKQLVEACFLLSPETLWNLSRKDDDSKISAYEIRNELVEMRDAYASKTLYQVASSKSNGAITADYVESLVDGIADLLDECVAIEFYVDSDGVLQQIDLTLTSTEVTFEQEELEQLKQLLANVNGTVTLKRSYQLKQDYSQVIEQVNAYYNSLEQTVNA